MVKKSKNKLANLESNLFCLCPSCHGEMQYGSSMGKDMSQLVKKAQEYAKYIEEKISTEEFDDDSDCLVQEWVDNDIELKGFNRPIVCEVVVNGKQRRMAFSWEHFMKIAFIFENFNDVSEEGGDKDDQAEISDWDDLY
ncbi:MAG: hypothetical protein LUE92_16745 [Clostridiales bacterium]|nr:hypothetical protein [Clostridiales bacterium]